MYYHDRYRLEADAVLHLDDGRYALIEVRLGQSKVGEGIEHLNTIESHISEYNETTEGPKLRLPDVKMVIMGTDVGYMRDDGVAIVPIECLRD